MSHETSAAPLLFARREPTESTAAEQYHGTDTEMDLKGPTLLSARAAATSDSVADQYFGTDAELDPKDAAPNRKTV